MNHKTDFDVVIEDLLDFTDREDETRSRETTVRGKTSSKPASEDAIHAECASSAWLPFKHLGATKHGIPSSDGIYFLRWNCHLHTSGLYSMMRVHPGATGVPSVVHDKIKYLQSNGATNAIVYIGRAKHLDHRLKSFKHTATALTRSLSFFPPIPGSHRGGKYLWALQATTGTSAYDNVFCSWVPLVTLARWVTRSELISSVSNRYWLSSMSSPSCLDFERFLLHTCSASYGHSSFVLPIGNETI